MAGHRFIDHDDSVPVRCVGGSKDSALPELYPQRFKVARTYGFGNVRPMMFVSLEKRRLQKLWLRTTTLFPPG